MATAFTAKYEETTTGSDDDNAPNYLPSDSDVSSVAPLDTIYRSDFNDGNSEEPPLDDTNIMFQDCGCDDEIDDGDIVTDNSHEPLTLCESDPDTKFNQPYSCSASTTTFNGSTPVNDTPHDSPPVNDFENVTFEERGHEAPTRFDVSEDSPPDSGNMSNAPQDHGYEDDGTQGNVLSLQASEALIVLSATSVPETWKFNVDFATETLPLDSPTLTAQRSEFDDPAHHDAREDASIAHHHKDLPRTEDTLTDRLFFVDFFLPLSKISRPPDFVSPPWIPHTPSRRSPRAY